MSDLKPRVRRGAQCYRLDIWHDGTAEAVARMREIADMWEATIGTPAEGLIDKPVWLESHTPNWGGGGRP